LNGSVGPFGLFDDAGHKIAGAEIMIDFIFGISNFVLGDVEGIGPFGQVLPIGKLCADSRHFIIYALPNNGAGVSFWG
jgi:hypothetical protein